MTNADFRPDWFSCPGDTIASLMARREYGAAELAKGIKKDTSFVLRLISGNERIDSDLAQKLSAHIGGSPSFWGARQKRYDEDLQRIADSMPPSDAKAWLKLLPLKEMRESGWITCENSSGVLRSAMSYFGVTNAEEWREQYASFATSFSYRTSPAFESKIGALAAWLRQGELQASHITCGAWSSDHFRRVLDDVRPLTKLKEPGSFLMRLRSMCSAAGVAVVFVKAPAGCRASGATRFVSSKKAMIILSFRHLSDDHFWFSFFHEAGHLLLHGKDATFVDGEAAEETQREREANVFAANALIPVGEHERLLNLRHTMKDVVRFAVSLGIAPGIVVGQMQHYGIIRPGQLNGLKRRYSWDQIQDALALI